MEALFRDLGTAISDLTLELFLTGLLLVGLLLVSWFLKRWSLKRRLEVDRIHRQVAASSGEEAGRHAAASYEVSADYQHGIVWCGDYDRFL